LARAEARRCSEELIDVLVAIHAVDYEAVGLGDFGHPDGYVERQVRRWGQQWERSKSADLPAIEELARRLRAALPDSPAPTTATPPRQAQRDAFSAQVGLAAETRRPVIVHTRDAEEDTRAIIVDAHGAGVKGVLHCYTGSHDLAAFAIEAGWYISFSGIVTFKKWADDELLRLVPEDRLLVESDAPYLAPVPFRGKRNEPSWVAHTLTKVAAARGVDPLQLGRTTASNTERLFGLALHAA